MLSVMSPNSSVVRVDKLAAMMLLVGSVLTDHVLVDTEHQVSRVLRLVWVAWTKFYIDFFLYTHKSKGRESKAVSETPSPLGRAESVA